MNITEILVTGYDGDKPVLAIGLDSDLVTTVLTATTEAGVVEAAQRRVVAVDDRATRVLEAVRELVNGLMITPTGSVPEAPGATGHGGGVAAGRYGERPRRSGAIEGKSSGV